MNKAINVAENDLDMMLLNNQKCRKESIEAMKQVFLKADSNGDEYLSREEFAAHFRHPCVKAFFGGLDLDINGVQPEELFDLLDFNGSPVCKGVPIARDTWVMSKYT